MLAYKLLQSWFCSCCSAYNQLAGTTLFINTTHEKHRQKVENLINAMYVILCSIHALYGLLHTRNKDAHYRAQMEKLTNILSPAIITSIRWWIGWIVRWRCKEATASRGNKRSSVRCKPKKKHENIIMLMMVNLYLLFVRWLKKKTIIIIIISIGGSLACSQTTLLSDIQFNNAHVFVRIEKTVFNFL